MPQILVGGDNQDAYSICEAIEQVSKPRGLAVVFCATPHEVQSTVGRGGVAAVVLNFEKAGLTNFELAYRIRESTEGRTVALLLPEVDALGDVEGTLGTQVAVFAFPVEPGVIAALVCRLLDGAVLPAAAGGREPTQPATGAAGAGRAGAGSETARQQPGRADGGAPAGEPMARSRRVRHRTWQEVRSPRREPLGEVEAEAADEDDAVPVVQRRQAGALRDPRRRALAIAVGVLLLAGLAYGSFRLLRPGHGIAGAGGPGATVALMCVACDSRDDRPVRNIHELRCRSCGGKLGFAFHCNDCKRDFGFAPPDKVKTLGDLQSKPECGKCKSWNCAAVLFGSPPAAPVRNSSAPAPAAKQGTSAPAPAAKKATPAPTPAKKPAVTPAKKATPAPAKAPAKAPVKPSKSTRPVTDAPDE